MKQPTETRDETLTICLSVQELNAVTHVLTSVFDAMAIKLPIKNGIRTFQMSKATILEMDQEQIKNIDNVLRILFIEKLKI